jgi:hypothetical protein
MNGYQLSVLRDWRRSARLRGQHARRRHHEEAADWRLPAAGAPSTQRGGSGCFGCYRDARALRAVGHSPGCRLAAGPGGVG